MQFMSEYSLILSISSDLSRLIMKQNKNMDIKKL